MLTLVNRCCGKARGSVRVIQVMCLSVVGAKHLDGVACGKVGPLLQMVHLYYTILLKRHRRLGAFVDNQLVAEAEIMATLDPVKPEPGV